MRYSRQRESVLHQVESLYTHPTAEEVYEQAVKECPSLSLGTVYRNLNSLVEAGLVRRVSIPGQADRFDHTLRWHGHLYCTVCGGVSDLVVDKESMEKVLAHQTGEIRDCVLTLIGVCEQCAAKHTPQHAE